MTDRKKEKKLNGHPIQIIDIEMNPNHSSKMCLTGNLKHITQDYGEKNVALISIAGPSRQGKSFLLSFIIRYLTALEKNSTSKWLGKTTSSKPLVGFPFQNCLERQTIGLWLWSRPFLIKNEKGEEIAVFVMDTQGVFDEHTTSREWSAIVGLSLLTSSCLIYNVVQNLQEDVLQILETFIQYGMLAMKEGESGEKCFQKLTFLIRDWNMPDECDYGPLGGQKFLDYRLNIKDHLPKASVRIRKTMKTCFEELSCFLMPDPGNTAKGNDFKGSLKELDPKFIECLTSLMDTLLSPEQIKVKKVGGEPLKGKHLAQIFQRYVSIFNSDEMPSTVCLLDATAHSVCETMVAKIQDKFKQEFQDNMEICGFINEKEFNALNDMLTKAALMDFDKKKKFGDEKIARKHKRRLESDLLELSIQMKEENENKKITKSTDIQEKLLGGFSTMFLELVQKEYCLHEELDELVNHETEKILAEFCNSFDNNKTILDDQVPTFNSKIMDFVHSLHVRNDEKINKAKEVARSIVDVCYTTYENELNFKLLQAPNSILDDEFIIAVETILRKQALTFFDSKFQIPCEKLSQHFKTELEILMNTKVEEIGKKNSGKKSEQIMKVEALIENIVNLYQGDIATALKQEISPTKAFLQNQHMKFYQKYSDLFLSQAGISDLNVLTPFIQNLNMRLNNSLDEANAELINIQNEIKLDVESQIEQTRKEYHNNMMEVLTAKTVCTEEELKTRHLNFMKICDQNFQAPEFLSNKEKNELRCRLIDELEQEFEILSNQYQNKLHECDAGLNMEIENVVLEYRNRMETYLGECSEVSQMENKHKEISRFLDDVFSQKTAFLPQDMELQYRQRLEQLISKEFEIISDKFVTRKLETEQQVILLYNQCFSEYIAEINEKMLDVSEEKLLKQWHEFIKNRWVNQFSMKVQSFKPDHTEIKLKLENQICKSFDDLLKENEERQQEQEEKVECLIENSLEVYKQSMEEILMADCCENEPDFQQREKRISLSCITKYEEGGENIPLNILKQKKQILNTKIESEKQAYFDMFRQKIVNNLEAKQKYIPEILSAYQKLMEDFILNNPKVCISKLQEMHEIFSNSAAENVPASVFKYIFSEVKINLQQSYCAFEIKMKTEHSLREKAGEFLSIWKVKIDTDIQKHSLNISDDCELSAIKCSLNDEFNKKLREEKIFEEKRIRGICAELEFYLEEVCNKAKINIMKNESDSHMMTMVRNTALQIYEKEMAIHLGPADFVHPNVLEKFHQQATEIALQNIRNQKLIAITSSLTKNLTLLFDHSFSRYRDINRRNTPVKPAIGIDLGTTFSCVAVYNAGKVTIIPNENGKNTTPSYVAFNKMGPETVGESAKSQAHLHPENTIFDAKRLIGRSFDDPIVQADIKQWPFKVIDFSGVPKIQVNNENYWPEEISAKILKKMKEMAEKHLNCTVENAVITVPAYFNDSQKKATMDAGRFAGLNVLGILNEPTAAAVAYSLNYACEKSRKVLIFDFGGGTFDIAVLEIHNGNIDAKAVDGDTHLGGEDFDSNVVKYCVEKFQAETNFDLLADQNSEDLRKRKDVSRRIRRLRGECERQKINLTGSTHATVNVEAIYEKMDLKVDISRQTFEAINQELLDKTMQIVERALKHAKINKDDIDDIVLVGGSTRIPKVQSLLKTYFKGKALNLNINADEAVAQGAAIYASILNGDQAVKLKKIRLTDVTPLSIGVEEKFGQFSPIINKNTPIPTKMVQKYITTAENQKSVHIKIYEGESAIASNNHLLGEFELDGIPEGPKGSQAINITMKIDVNGILNVEAECSGGNVSKNLTIIKNKGKLMGGLSQQK